MDFFVFKSSSLSMIGYWFSSLLILGLYQVSTFPTFLSLFSLSLTGSLCCAKVTDGADAEYVNFHLPCKAHCPHWQNIQACSHRVPGTHVCFIKLHKSPSSWVDLCYSGCCLWVNLQPARPRAALNHLPEQ